MFDIKQTSIITMRNCFTVSFSHLIYFWFFNLQDLVKSIIIIVHVDRENPRRSGAITDNIVKTPDDREWSLFPS